MLPDRGTCLNSLWLAAFRRLRGESCETIARAWQIHGTPGRDHRDQTGRSIEIIWNLPTLVRHPRITHNLLRIQLELATTLSTDCKRILASCALSMTSNPTQHYATGVHQGRSDAKQVRQINNPENGIELGPWLLNSNLRYDRHNVGTISIFGVKTWKSHCSRTSANHQIFCSAPSFHHFFTVNSSSPVVAMSFQPFQFQIEVTDAVTIKSLPCSEPYLPCFSTLTL